MKRKTNLNPIVKEQVPINLKGVDSVAHLISKMGSFCEAQKCFVRDQKEIVPIGKKISFIAMLRNSSDDDICNSKRLDVLIQYDKDQITEAATIREIGAGSYEVSYVRQFAGSHTVSEQVGGEPVPGSPFL